MPSLQVAISKNLVRLRNARGLTQEQLGKKASLARSTIARLEVGGGGITLDTVSRLASALEIEETDLTFVGEAPAPIKVEHDVTECLRRVSKATLSSLKKTAHDKEKLTPS